jgi:hypothetical protein
MRQRSRGHLVRLCLTLGLLAATWASILALTGGVSFEVATTRVSSRNPRTPFAAEALAPLGYLAPKAGAASVPVYSNRVTLRYDRIPPRELDAVIADLGQLGRPMYVLLEDWEVESFRARFETSSVVGALDWPPAARHPGGVTLYEVADRMAPVDAPRRALEPMN